MNFTTFSSRQLPPIAFPARELVIEPTVASWVACQLNWYVWRPTGAGGAEFCSLWCHKTPNGHSSLFDFQWNQVFPDFPQNQESSVSWCLTFWNWLDAFFKSYHITAKQKNATELGLEACSVGPPTPITRVAGGLTCLQNALQSLHERYHRSTY